ncbi:zinc ribbon domain-containing protein [Alkalibacter mobilis]|uniref:zinc ribbon domain-containing protein n=1 Tax=Alkalibacter mobilis TaxID=2787712 RepID=UPI00189FC08E|nr:zinc ribbon domain-containing protein [Alkalibacter mobilis]MBF7097012.1 zinc ribbon domain-containing protein [Alkalibacter mobilis]
MSKKEISDERKTLYYVGIGVSTIGFILFISTFFSFMNPESMFDSGPGLMMAKPVIGVLMVGGGSAIRRIAARGAAGSGLILDPDKAREDLSPWSKMAGGMLNDALEETSVKSEPIIKIKCQNCSALNDEDSKFCKECGKEI